MPAQPASPDPASLPFEEAYQRLKAITAELENEQLPLEDSLQRYAEALALAARCQSLLQEAEERITVLQNGAYVPAQIDVSD